MLSWIIAATLRSQTACSVADIRPITLRLGLWRSMEQMASASLRTRSVLLSHPIQGWEGVVNWGASNLKVLDNTWGDTWPRVVGAATVRDVE